MRKSKINFGAILLTMAFVTFNLVSIAQGNHKEFSEWKELKDFHTVISKTFHPMEEGNFKPIKERSGELYASAKKLDTSKIPADLNKPEVVSAVKELTARTKELDALIKAKGSDDQIRPLLTSVHDTFHRIVGLCSKDDGHDEGNHEHNKENKSK